MLQAGTPDVPVGWEGRRRGEGRKLQYIGGRKSGAGFFWVQPNEKYLMMIVYDDMGKMNLGLGVFTRVLIYTKYRSDA